MTNDSTNTSPNTIKLFYRNHMSSAYKVDERAIQEIIQDNVTCTNAADKIHLIIYYTDSKTSNLLVRNSLNTSKDKLKRTNVVYRFPCPYEDCRLRESWDKLHWCHYNIALKTPYYAPPRRCTKATHDTGTPDTTHTHTSDC